MGSCELPPTALGWPQTMILLICTFLVARITGLSHQHSARGGFSTFEALLSSVSFLRKRKASLQMSRPILSSLPSLLSREGHNLQPLGPSIERNVEHVIYYLIGSSKVGL
jgi:hypothetical protein